MSGSLWPGNLRCKVDALFSNAGGQELFDSVQKHYLKASPKTIVMFAFFTGGHTKPKFDGAFAIDAKIYGGPWTMWDQALDDKENIAWHEKCVDLLKPHISAHYVGETNTTGHAEFAKASFKEASWEKLKTLRAKYDPSGVFFNFTDGLA
jgi:FAD/FMN-containing dehydrogenase